MSKDKSDIKLEAVHLRMEIMQAKIEIFDIRLTCLVGRNPRFVSDADYGILEEELQMLKDSFKKICSLR